ncbi:ferrochelatase [Ekhidna sp.]|uniref:ferrochelatase n=1 Tax=Ekhidna sp. TaxID=2608089 RepID=UPI0032EE08CB
MTKKKGVLLVNLGTPDSTSVPDVRKYLREFLMDKRVIDIPPFKRWLLINLIIAPFRAPKSAKEYDRLFDEKGSPLKYYGFELRDKLRKAIDDDWQIELAMRYQNPSIAEGLDALKDCTSIHVIPLFPQYASASTGSVQDKVMEIVKDWQIIPDITFTSQFFEEELFLETIADNARKLMEKTNYDHFLFSYHGIPERQITKGDISNTCSFGNCCDSMTPKNRYCYRAQCYATTRLLAEKLGLKEDQFSVSFQSRLGKTPWIKPYTDVLLEKLAEQGNKKVLAFSPSFIADCLETTVEVGETYQEDFIKAGGDQWDLVPSLNVEDKWVECLKEMIVRNN